ncbi:hypothetical protein [Cupriavidus basilensis]|uniref:hypothetical protein n=1 Tax=Cupriavidus basilensis TaxID=68895 RepID=UPI002844C394|nr:hypothetical protein [Cupriavidus basilensis]MDR3383750.1 hypothetical protein [Cupriavidus basilensis]
MPIWSVASVEERPQVTLSHWTVYETDRGERHFVGRCMDSNSGRVSSAISSFDMEARTGTTRSGRRYVLSGGPGRDPDGLHTWTLWKLLNDVKEEKNVTPDYVSAAHRLI